MLGAALGLVVATGLAIGAGFYLQYLLLQFLQGMQILAILTRATVLCAFGNRYLFDCGSTSWSNRVG